MQQQKIFFSNYKTCISIVKNVKNIQVIQFQKLNLDFKKKKSRCVICLTKRTFIDEIDGKYDIENELEIYLKFLAD